MFHASASLFTPREPSAVTDLQLTSGGPLQLVEQLAALVRRRVEEEQAIADAHALRVARAETERHQRQDEISQRFDARRAAAQRPETMQAEVLMQYDAERESVQQRLKKASRKMRRRYRARLKAAKKKRDRIHAGEWARFDAQKRQLEERVAVAGELASLRRAAIAELALAADKLLAQRGLAPPRQYESPKEETFDRDNHELFATAMQRGEMSLAAMRSLNSARFASGQGLVLGFVGFAIVGAIAAGVVWGFEALAWVAGAAGIAGIIGSLIVNRAASPLAKKQTLALYGFVRGALADAQAAAAGALADAKGDRDQQLAALTEKRDRKIRQADAARSKEALTMKATFESKLTANAEKVAARLARMDRERDSAIAAATGGLPQRLAELEQQHARAIAALDDDHAQHIAECLAQRDEELGEVDEDWQAALKRWESALATLEAWSQQRFAPWPQLEGARDARFACDGVRFGDYLFSPADFLPPAAASEPPAWASAKSYAMPGILSFHERPALVLAAPAARRTEAVDALYNVAMRMMASIGSSDLRCTIIDAAGSAARFEPLLEQAEAAGIPIQIAATGEQIERALGDYWEHIERVKGSSSELAEPHRVLVVLGLPPGAAPAIKATLQQIIVHGACGGVTTLACFDAEPRAALPLDADQLAAHWLALRADDAGDFLLAHPMLGGLRVSLDEPPSPHVAVRLLRWPASSPTNGHAGSANYAAARR